MGLEWNSAGWAPLLNGLASFGSGVLHAATMQSPENNKTIVAQARTLRGELAKTNTPGVVRPDGAPFQLAKAGDQPVPAGQPSLPPAPNAATQPNSTNQPGVAEQSSKADQANRPTQADHLSEAQIVSKTPDELANDTKLREDAIEKRLRETNQYQGKEQVKLLAQLTSVGEMEGHSVLGTINANDQMRMRAYGQAVAGAGTAIATGYAQIQREDQMEDAHRDKLAQLADQTDEIRQGAIIKSINTSA